jgi:hypothetical protein
MAFLTRLQNRAEAKEFWDEVLLAPAQRVSGALREGRGMWGLGVEQEAHEALEQLPQGLDHAPYLRRDLHDPLCERLTQALGQDGATLVVVCGPSKSGKSRLLWEAIQETLGDVWLLRPRDAAALATLAHDGPPLETQGPCLVWLDDTERFLEEPNRGGLSHSTMAALEQWNKTVIVLGARGGKRPASSELDPAAYADPLDDLIACYPEPLWLRPELSDNELRQLRAGGYHERAIQQICSIGIGAFMIAAPRLVRRLELEQDHLDGVAVVRAAIDWRRLGILRPIPRVDLLGMLAANGSSHMPLSEKELEHALTWATKPLYASVALLNRVHTDDGNEAYEPYDYVVAHADRDGPPVSLARWRYVIDHGARIDELATNVGFAALMTSDDRELGSMPFRRADERGSAIGACNLGLLLWKYAAGIVDPAERRGLFDESESAFRRASARGDTAASSNLGVMLEQLSAEADSQIKRDQLIAEAEDLHRKATDGDDAHAASNLALFLERQALQADDEPERRRLLAEAEQVVRQADKGGSSIGAFSLGHFLLQSADRAEDKAERNRLLLEAEGAYMRADKRGDERGSFNLGLLLLDRAAQMDHASGHQLLVDSLQAFERAYDGGIESAMYYVGYVLSKQSLRATTVAKRERLLDEAEGALRRADEMGDAEAANDLALILRHRAAQTSDETARGRLFAEGEEAFRRADERGSRNGAYNVASLFSQRAAMAVDEKELNRLQDETEAALRRAAERERDQRSAPAHSDSGEMHPSDVLLRARLPPLAFS